MGCNRPLRTIAPGLALLLIFGGLYTAAHFLSRSGSDRARETRVVDYAVQTNIESDQSDSLQGLLNSGADVVNLGSNGRIRASVIVPAHVTLRSEGAVLVPVNGARFVVATGGSNVSLDGILVDCGPGSGGNATTAFAITHSRTTLSSVAVVGDSQMYGVTISGTQPVDDVTIKDSTFRNTSYGILKNHTQTHRLLIQDNTFTSVHRGDAVELNVGGDIDVVVRGNTIDDVRASGLGNAGFGIGIAGNGDYGQPVGKMSSGCQITENKMTRVEREAVHLEVMANCRVEGNYILGDGASTATVGIALYGSASSSIVGNKITGVNVGVRDALGVRNGHFVNSPSGNRVVGNSIHTCRLGIESFISGEGGSFVATGNEISGCLTGMRHSGSSQVTISNNSVDGAATSGSYHVDLRPNASDLVSSTAKLIFESNLANGEAAQITTP